MRRVSRRNSSVLIIRPVPAAATNREAEFGGGSVTATARLVPAVSAACKLLCLRHMNQHSALQ